MRSSTSLVFAALILAGCGTTRTTDTSRTATEQLLISTAIDEALEKIGFDPLRGRTVFVDNHFAASGPDTTYLEFVVREKLLQSGARLRETKDDADVVVALAVGALGTDRYEWLIGVPQLGALPSTAAFPIPPALPEIPLIKKTNQHGVAKVRLIAYERADGQLIALSDQQPLSRSDNQSTWVAGVGPFERGSVRRRTRIAGTPIELPVAPQVAQPADQASPKAAVRR